MAIDPFLPLREWRSSLYRGDPAVIDRFLDRIDSTLPANWTRDCGYEQTRLRPERIHCYLFEEDGVAARLWLQRVTATRVRGGPIQVLRHPPSGDTGQVARLVADFADACVLSAARETGIHCTRPVFGPRSAVTPAAEMLFTRFADTSDGNWPLTSPTQEMWEELISGCLADQVAIDRDELANWLAHSGWDQKDIALIVNQFFADSELLAKRLAITLP